jgi:hypothetical protein
MTLKTLLFICDDRAVYNDARFILPISIWGPNKIVSTLKVSFLQMLMEKNIVIGRKPASSIDPEDMVNTKTNSLVWISEGARVVTLLFLFCRSCYPTADLRKLVNEFDLPGNLSTKRRTRSQK